MVLLSHGNQRVIICIKTGAPFGDSFLLTRWLLSSETTRFSLMLWQWWLILLLLPLNYLLIIRLSSLLLPLCHLLLTNLVDNKLKIVRIPILLRLLRHFGSCMHSRNGSGEVTLQALPDLRTSLSRERIGIFRLE